MRKRHFIVISTIAIAMVGLYFWQSTAPNAGHSFFSSTQTEPTLYGNVDIRAVNLSFRVGGRLATVNVDEGDTLKAGQILATLDDQPYRIAIDQAAANVDAAKARLDLLLAGTRQEEIAQAQAQVAQFEAVYRYAKSTYDRQQRLAVSKVISADQLDNAKTARDQSQANLKTAQDKLVQLQNGARPQELQQANAQVMQAQAALAKAQLDLADSQLLAPAAGVVMTRTVEPGSLVAAGAPILTLSLTRPIWVRAYIDEVNLSQAVPGRKVSIYSDSLPDKVYTGKIGFVSPTAEFTPKTVETEVLRTSLVYRLRIIVENPDDALRQGMPVTLKFKPE